jgi:hypothetical protein
LRKIGLRAQLIAGTRDIKQRSPAQPPPRRKHAQRFENVGFARAIGTEQADRARVKLKLKRGVVAEISEREARDVERVHHSVVCKGRAPSHP